MRYLATALLCLASLVGSAYGQSDCTGDISGDGRTDGVDLAIVLTNWGPCNPGSAISGVYPQSGSTAGGTPIAIVGVDLGATASVTIDGVGDDRRRGGAELQCGIADCRDRGNATGNRRREDDRPSQQPGPADRRCFLPLRGDESAVGNGAPTGTGSGGGDELRTSNSDCEFGPALAGA